MKVFGLRKRRGPLCQTRTSLVLGILWLGSPIYGQESPRADAEKEEKDSKVLEGSTQHTLVTSDGVYLSARLWVPKNSTKETPVVILCHMRGRSQRDLFPFAKYLFENGLAVCTFDFRGHGESREVDPTLYKRPAEAMKLVKAEERSLEERVIPRGEREVKEAKENAGPSKPKKTEKIDQADEFRSGKELAFALPVDLQQVKLFLLTQHNDGRFNIRRSGIVGAEMSAMVVLEWMHKQEFKVGRQRGWAQLSGDLGAVVLLSPQTAYEGHKLATEFDKLGGSVPMMLITGNEKKAVEETERLARKLRVPLKSLKKPANGERKSASKTRGTDRPASGWFSIETELVGTDMLRPPVGDIDKYIGGFLKDNLTGDKERNWERREVTPEGTGFGSG